jgi:ATP-dependent Clp protease ATP-binding subunit ClpA
VTAADYERFSDAAHRAVILAERLARQAGRDLAGPEDLLVALAQTDLEVRTILEQAGTTADVLAQRVAEWTTVGSPVEVAAFSPSLHRAVMRASRYAVQERSDDVTGRHLLRGLVDGEDEVVWRVLISVGVDPAAVAGRRDGGASGAGRSAELHPPEATRPRIGRPRLLALWRA